MSDRQYKTAHKAIELDLKQAKRLGCTISCEKLRGALRRLEIKYLKPDITGFEAMDITKESQYNNKIHLTLMESNIETYYVETCGRTYFKCRR